MSVKIFNEVAEKFLTDDEARVLAIKGDWGVGKTYAWRSAVAHVGKKVKPDKYCYVSLFGLTSVKDIRMAMLGGIESDSTQKYFGAAIRRMRGLFEQISVSESGVGVAGKGISLSLDAIAPYLLKNMVICFDDLERTGSDLSHEVLMGFISTLKETAGCKIALILNEEKLTHSQATYAIYREKVIDQEISFSPTVDEAIQWGVAEDLPMRDIVIEAARRLNIVNVRVLKKIGATIRLLAHGMTQIRAEVQREAVMSAVVIGWSYFDKSGAAPSVEYLKSWTILGPTSKGDKVKPTAAEEQQRQLLNAFGFMHFDEFDAAILKVVEQGYLQDSGFEAEAKKRSTLYANGDLEQCFRNAWRLFHESFDANAEDVAGALDREARRAVKIIGPMDLNATVDVLRKLGREDLAEPLIEFYMQEREGDANFWDLSANPFGREVADPAIRRAFAEKARRIAPTVSLREAVEFMAQGHGWNAEHMRAVAAATDDDFYRLFKGPLTVRRRKSAIEAALRATAMSEGGGADRVMRALRRIAAESPINALRLNWLITPSREAASGESEADG